jgi:hypothetical protein
MPKETNFDQETFSKTLNEFKISLIDKSLTNESVQEFQNQLLQEIQKINALYVKKEQEILDIIAKIGENLEVEEEEIVHSPREKIRGQKVAELSQQLEMLKDFAFQNISKITKFLKKCDQDLEGFQFYQKLIPDIKKYEIYSSPVIDNIEKRVNLAKSDQFEKNTSKTEKPIFLKNLDLKSLVKQI